MDPTLATRHRQRLKRRERTPVAEGGTMGEKWPNEFCRKWRLPRHFCVLLHAVILRHGTDGFTSFPKEGALRAGLNPRTWVRKASTLPPDHRSRCKHGNQTVQCNAKQNEAIRQFWGFKKKINLFLLDHTFYSLNQFFIFEEDNRTSK